MLCAFPIRCVASTSVGSGWAIRYSLADTPRKTPVRLPATRSQQMPASSSASQATSRTMRCWGSMLAASRAESPKKCGSKRATLSRKPLQRVFILPGREGSSS